MKIEDYEKYYQSTDFYVIPTEVFKELFNELEAWKEQTKRDEEMIRLDQTKKVFETIADVIKNGSCSYRHLIYDELGFDGEYYEELISGMTITNAICDLEELREQHEEDLEEMEKLTSIWKAKSEENRELKELLHKIMISGVEVKSTPILDLYNEKEQLKKQLHEASLTIQEMTEQDIWCPSNCDKLEKLLKENEELKKQLEENKNPLKEVFAQVNDDTLLRDCGFMQFEINGYKTQQEEFINYLEDMLNNENDIFSVVRVKDVLQKYKSIIGDDK